MLASVSKEKEKTIKEWYDFERWLDPWLWPFLAIPFNFWLAQLGTLKAAPSWGWVFLRCIVLKAVQPGSFCGSVTPSSLYTRVTTNLKRCNFLGSSIFLRWTEGGSEGQGSHLHVGTRMGGHLCPSSPRLRGGRWLWLRDRVWLMLEYLFWVFLF